MIIEHLCHKIKVNFGKLSHLWYFKRIWPVFTPLTSFNSRQYIFYPTCQCYIEDFLYFLFLSVFLSIFLHPFSPNIYYLKRSSLNYTSLSFIYNRKYMIYQLIFPFYLRILIVLRYPNGKSRQSKQNYNLNLPFIV